MPAPELMTPEALGVTLEDLPPLALPETPEMLSITAQEPTPDTYDPRDPYMGEVENLRAELDEWKRRPRLLDDDGGDTSLLCTVASYTTVGGAYTLRRVRQTAPGRGHLQAIPDVPLLTPCYNDREELTGGVVSYPIPVGTPVLARPLTCTDGTTIYRFLAVEDEWSHANPMILGPTDSEQELAATDGPWNRGSQGTIKGVTIRLQTRTAYNANGDKTLYAFYRNFTFDDHGRLVGIGTENRVTVDVTEVC
jgi:hypothetical protein